MANIVVTKPAGNIVVVYNDAAGKFSRYTRNMTTGLYVAELANDNGIETDILCNQRMQYTHDKFDTIGGVTIDSNTALYDELVKML